ncbi:MAG TPA: PTS lactose transporter subunit IIB [Pseudonocardiaceae bacterium]|jgi:PTS system mannitol-specific IIB component|nr:PTS lactose transporter subunit IIB [Pseudonocardiaceae bacterium]
MNSINGSDIKKLVVACDAGMGSSVMLAAQLAKSLKKYSVTVEHSPVNSIPDDADLVLCQQILTDRARRSAPDKVVLGFQLFLGDPLFGRVEAAIKDGARLDG